MNRYTGIALICALLFHYEDMNAQNTPYQDTLGVFCYRDTCYEPANFPGTIICFPVYYDPSMPPVINGCPPNITVNTSDDEKGNCTTTAHWTPPNITDDCKYIVRYSAKPDTTFFSTGVTTVTYIAHDFGNPLSADTCSFTVTVIDNEPASISFGGCPPSIVTTTSSESIGDCKAGVAVPRPSYSFSDNCRIGIDLFSKMSGATTSGRQYQFDQTMYFKVNPGITSVTLTGISYSFDSNVGIKENQEFECTFTITVTDDEAPVFINCPEDITVGTSADGRGNCRSAAHWSEPKVRDNCDGLIVPVGNFTSGNIFQVGETLVEYQVQDASGNVQACSFTITVEDDEPPIWQNCPQNITTITSFDGGYDCLARVSWLEPVATDNCDGMLVPTSNYAPGDDFEKGETLVRYQVEDLAGNFQTCSFTITVMDNQPPVIENCPQNVSTTTSSDGGYDCWTAVIWTIPTAFDNCDQPFIPTADHSFIFGLGTTVVTFSATDAAGSTGTCSFSVIVSDDQAPYFIDCPANIVTTTGADGTGDCLTVVTWIPPTTSDNCYENLLTPTSSHSPGESFGLGITDVTYNVSDSYSNAAIPCSFKVVVTDDELPVAKCPEALTVGCAAAVPAASVGSVVATDNCGTISKLHIGDVTINQTCANRKIITRSYRATDASGNSTTCSQVITVEDNTLPEFTFVPANVTVQCNNLPPVGFCTATDNCGGAVSITYNGQTTTGTCTLTRKWTATDACGNTRAAIQQITVVDIQKPNFVNIPSNITVQCDAVPQPAKPMATDICDPMVAVTYNGQTKTNGSCPNSYVLTRRWIAADDCNNTRSVSQRITVVDNGKPMLVVPANMTIACHETPPPVGTPTASDGCTGAVAITYLGQTTSNSQCPGTYDILRIWRAADACGNNTVAGQTITVQDNNPPVFTGFPENVTIQCNQNLPPLSSPTASDSCGGYVFITYLGQVATGSGCSSDYTVTRTWRAQDMCGNTVLATQVITVQGNNNYGADPVISRLTDPSRLATESAKFVLQGDEAPGMIRRTTGSRQTNIQVQPNPTTDRIAIDLSGFTGEAVTVSIFSDLGRLVWQRKLNARDEPVVSVSLREAGAPAGIFTLHVQDVQTTVTKRVVLVN
jgi:hypothetical protein